MFKPSMAYRRKRVPLLLLLIAAVAVVSSVVVLSPGKSSAQTRDDSASSSCLSCFGFIKFDGIEGEAVQVGHEGWSDMQSFNQSIVGPSAGPSVSSRRKGAATFGDIVVVKEVDASSPKLAEAVANGTVFPTVEVHLTKLSSDGSQEVYYSYKLKNVRITSYNIGTTGQDGITPSGLPLVAAGGPSDLPVEQVSLNFEEIKATYTRTGRDGSAQGKVEYTWKVEEGVK